MTEYYKEKLEAGLAYQDYVCEQLRKHDPCMIVLPYSSHKWQISKGESASGIEIKHDMRMCETRNLYFETAEKSNAENKNYVPSGIYRKDNTWLYLIGDYDEAFLFSKHQLQKIYEDKEYCKRHRIYERLTPTSKGFTYPIEEALKGYCLYHYIFSNREDNDK